MKLQIRGKNVPLTDSLKDYVEKRLGKLDKYFEISPEAIVTLVVEKDRHRVEVTIALNGYLLRGEEESPDMYASVDLVLEKLEKQINKYKTRLGKKIKMPGIREKAFGLNEAGGDEKPLIVRTKRFAIKPMAVDEAVMQMNLLGHSFYVFFNADTEEVNVLYRRKDGNYGLIEPEF